MKKRNMMVVTMLLLVVLLIGGGTFAWFTASTEPVVNEFKAGTLIVDLVDEFEGAPNVNPGDCYDKVVYVENTGTKRAVVRIKADFNGLPAGMLSACINTRDWMKIGDYWVYKHVLNEGDKTSHLFTMDKVCISWRLPNEYQGAEFDITLMAEGIQATHQAPFWNGWGVYVCGLSESGSRSSTGEVSETADAAALAEIADMEAKMAEEELE